MIIIIIVSFIAVGFAYLVHIECLIRSTRLVSFIYLVLSILEVCWNGLVYGFFIENYFKNYVLASIVVENKSIILFYHAIYVFPYLFAR